jgi:hypothetical protein
VFHVALGGFDKIGDEVVSAFELDVNLGPGVVDLITEANQGVVDANHKENQQDHDSSNNDGSNCASHSGSPLIGCVWFGLLLGAFLEEIRNHKDNDTNGGKD